MKSIKFLMLIVAIIINTNSYSQKGNKIDKNRVRSHKVAFITDQLNLSVKEAEVFWPIYNAHEKLMSQYRREEVNAMKSIIKNPNKPFLSQKNFDDINENEATKIYNEVANIRNKTHQEKESFFTIKASSHRYIRIIYRKVNQTFFKC